ncbi:MAG: aspartate--ammonia ligase, partial [Bacilli bacterium]|nr:aspartate--ammonia ligase [Bacilli bacterium]
RFALGKYGFEVGQGLYADMNAIRRDETLDNLHSLYVDQWDWEKAISKEERNKGTLREAVKTIFAVLKEEEKHINALYPSLNKKLPEEITFITSKELEERYPTLNRKERENAFAREVKAYFLEEIGWPLEDGKPHDGRAPDYDDWKLNGDIILYNPVLDWAFEISSMGIRVDASSLKAQVAYQKKEDMLLTPYSQAIVEESLPFTIGGGIGESRLCMFFLEKAHIGEIQCSLWDEKDIEELSALNIELL